MFPGLEGSHAETEEREKEPQLLLAFGSGAHILM